MTGVTSKLIAWCSISLILQTWEFQSLPRTFTASWNGQASDLQTKMPKSKWLVFKDLKSKPVMT